MKNKVCRLLLFICFAFAVTISLPTTVFAAGSEHEHCFQECKHGGFDLDKLNFWEEREDAPIPKAHTSGEMSVVTGSSSTCPGKGGVCFNKNTCNGY